ncbi:MAG TPA: GTPase Era [Clostridiales bacterium]|jgi:GTP-binding protein Era|nr:GTPase Era [Clostridiales bacterium]
MKSGFIAILGRPNVGKSSLLNAIIGTKIAIVTPKPQTTRRRITGILTQDDTQLVFTDTPGVFKSKNVLGDYMMKEVKTASEETDIILLVFDATDGLTNADKELIEKYQDAATVIAAINKTDIAKPDQVLPMIDELRHYEHISEIVPISALKGKNIDVLIDVLKKYIKDDVFFYPKDQVTDQSLRERVSELIREKAMFYLQQEIPHGVAVDIERYEDGDIIEIDALIICEKDNHKGIIIGSKGSTLKKIGSKAREELEFVLGKKVFLTLYVKVIKDWRKRKNILYDLGYYG